MSGYFFTFHPFGIIIYSSSNYIHSLLPFSGNAVVWDMMVVSIRRSLNTTSGSISSCAGVQK